MKVSAGVLPYRWRDGPEVLLGHPGGPFWARRDAGAWTVVKGEVEPGEDLLAAAVREFAEETGLDLSDRAMVTLGTVTQRSGKVVHVWACRCDLDPEAHRPGTFEMEWPPRSGRTRSFPEIDRVAWFRPDEARRALNPAQRPFIDRLEALAGS